LQPVHGGLGEQWVGHHGQDLGAFAVAGDDGRRVAVAFDDELAEVAGFGGPLPTMIAANSPVRTAGNGTERRSQPFRCAPHAISPLVAACGLVSVTGKTWVDDTTA
jgi:hypothetical protein